MAFTKILGLHISSTNFDGGNAADIEDYLRGILKPRDPKHHRLPGALLSHELGRPNKANPASFQ